MSKLTGVLNLTINEAMFCFDSIFDGIENPDDYMIEFGRWLQAETDRENAENKQELIEMADRSFQPFDLIVNYMDKEIADNVNGMITGCWTNQEFFEEYDRQHKAFYGEYLSIN